MFRSPSSFLGRAQVINDDAMINPWNMLAYRMDLQWHKPPVGYEWYYDCQAKSKDHGDPEYEARIADKNKNWYPWGGWCVGGGGVDAERRRS